MQTGYRTLIRVLPNFPVSHDRLSNAGNVNCTPRVNNFQSGSRLRNRNRVKCPCSSSVITHRCQLSFTRNKDRRSTHATDLKLQCESVQLELTTATVQNVPCARARAKQVFFGSPCVTDETRRDDVSTITLRSPLRLWSISHLHQTMPTSDTIRIESWRQHVTYKLHA